MIRVKHRPACPSPAELVAWRRKLDLSHEEAAGLVFYGYRAWMQWEDGSRQMHPALWELFQIKATKILKRREALPAILDRPRAPAPSA